MAMVGANSAGAWPLLVGVPPQVGHPPVITTPTANLTTVALQQSRTLINWQSFDVAQGQQVDFLFQTSSGIVLNRINSLAAIDGKILGCVATCGPGGRIGGNVWFDSPEGVLIGQHAEINVGGFLATTSPLISDRDFLNGSALNFKFGGGPASANVTVQSGAQITASGSVALISPSVTTGAGAKITAGGEVLYGAAENYIIEFDQTADADLNLVGFEVPASALSDGTVSATPLTLGGATTAGRVVVASVNRPTVMNAVIALGGMITATSASGAGGDIVLSATGAPATVEVGGSLQASHGVSVQAPNGGAVDVSGTVSTLSTTGAGGTIQIGGAGGGAVDLAAGARLDASSNAVGLRGGAVTLTGSAVQLDGTIAATGPAGGGTIRIGGGAHGADASVADATTTTIGADARIDDSATASGAGGQVVVWSNQDTSFQGDIVSRGGPSAGAGGAVEISSAGQLGYAGAVDLRAANGSAGQLLLDPSELIIIPTEGTGAISGGVNPVGGASSTLGADTINTALLNADVTISTHMAETGGDGVIAFNGGAGPLVFDNTGTTARTLTFDSQGGFRFDTSVVAKGQMNLTLDAGAAAITLPMGAYVHVTDGALTLSGSDLTLQGDLTATTIDLNASGAINQSGGVLTANSLTGSSGGSTSLTGANKLQGVETFTAGGDFILNTVDDATISGLQAAGVVNVTSTAGTLQASNVSSGSALSLSAAEDLFLSAAVTGPSTTLTAAGTINQLSGVITANTLTATAGRGISLTGANAVATLDGLSNTDFGGVAFTDASSLSLAGDISATAQNVSLVSSGAITQASGIITAGVLGAAAGGGLSLNGANAIASVSGLTSAGGDITFVDAAGFTLDGDVSAPNQTVSLASTGGGITQTAGSITAATFSAAAVDGLLLGGDNQISHVTSLSNSGSGGLSFNDNQSVTIDQVTLGGGDISLSSSSGDLTLTSAVTSPGALALAAAGNLTGTSLTSAGDLTITSGDTFAGAINFSSLTVGGDATLSAVTMSTPALQPTFTGTASSLNLTFTGALAPVDLSGTALSAPGSVSVAATAQSLTIGSITAGANVTLSTAGSLSQGGVGITAASLTASAVTGLQLGGSNAVASVTSLTNTTSGGVTFANTESVMIGSVNQGGDGGVDLGASTGDLTLASGITSASNVYISAANNLTVDGVTAASDVNLAAGGVLTETPGAVVTTGGSYSATALTMNAGAEQPVFTPTSQGSLNLTFTQSGSTIDLTGVPLSAPGSVTVQANNESLTVDSISAGSGQVTLTSGGTLAAASGATINLLNTYDDSYSATAVSLNLANPAIVQPVFSAPTYGYLSLTLTQGGGTVDLTGAPLSAPQQVTVQAGAANLTVDSITSGGGISLTSGGVLSAANGAALNLSGDYDVTTQTVDLTHPAVVQPTFAAGSTGSLNLTFTQSGGTIDLSSTPLSAPGSISVSLASSDSNENLTVGSLTAAGGVSLYTGSYATNGGALTVGSATAGGDVNLTTSYYYSGGGPITSGPISAGGSVNATGGDYASSTYSFADITAGNSVNLSTGTYYGGALTTGNISAGGSVSLSTGYYDSGALTVGTINSGSNANLSAGIFSSGVMTVGSIAAAGPVTLDAGGALQAANTSVTVQTGGSYAATGATIDPALFQPTFTGTTGDLSLTVTGGGGVDLSGHPLSAPGGSVAVSATAGDLTVDSISALQDITLSSSGDLAAAVTGEGPSTVTMTLGGNYSATGATIDPVLYQPTFTSQSFGALSLTFTSNQAAVDLTGHPLTAPGSVSVAASNAGLTVDSITAGGDVTLYAEGALQSADVSPFAIALGGDYSATGSTISSTLYQPTFAPTNAFGALNLTFTGSNGADLTGSALTAPGSISVSATGGPLTVDSLTAGNDVTLSTSGALQAASGAVISLVGDYAATANQIATANTTVLQPTFTSGSTGSLALTFTQAGATTDLTGFPLAAPGSVSVNAPNQNLTVDSITAGADVTLNSAGSLSNAGGAVITLGGDYSATGVTISTGLLQPSFTSGSTGSLNLTFNQSGAAVDLTGTPLSAPGSIAIQLGGDNENLTTDTLTALGGGVTISSYYYNGGAVTTGAINAGGSVNVGTASYYGGALNVGTINAGGSVNLATGYYAGAPLTAGPIVAGGDVTTSTGYNASAVTTVSSISAGGAVSLNSGGPLSAASTTTAGSINFTADNGELTVGALSATGNVSLQAYAGSIVGAPTTGVVLGGGYSASGTTIDTRLYQPTFTSGSNGDLSLTVTQTGSVFDLTGFPLTAPGSINLRSSEDLTIDSLTAGFQVNLSASGALNEVASSVITAQGLYASANNGIVLNGANAVQNVYNLYNGNTGGISFTNQGDIQLQGSVTANDQTVNLVSNTGAITEENCGYFCNSTIDAGALTASAVNGINLTGEYYGYYTNQINNLGPVVNTTTGGINILNQGNLALVGDVAAPGQAVNIQSESGALSQTGGVLTAATFTASAVNGITLNDANAVGSLGALTNTGSGGISFTNAGDLSIDDSVTAAFQTVNLVSNAGAVVEGPQGLVTAETLSGSAANGVHLDQANQVARVGDLANTGAGGVSFTNAGDVFLTGNVAAAGQTVSLVSQTGAIGQSTGAVTAGLLDLTAVTGVDLSGPNMVSQLGAVTTTSGEVKFVNAGSFALTADLDLAGQSLSLASNGGSIAQSSGAIQADSLTASAATGLSLTGSNAVTNLGLLQNGPTGGIAYTSVGDLTLASNLDGFAQAVSLTSQTGAIAQAPGQVIQAGLLSVSAANGIGLRGANAITDLNAASNSASGGVAINDADSLTILGAIRAAGQAVSLTGAGSINQLGGAVTAASLSASAVNGILLTDVSASLGPLVNTTDGGIEVASAGDLQLESNVTAPGQTVGFQIQGALGQAGGAITAATLSISATSGVQLGGANQVAALGDSINASGGFALTTIGDLVLSGNISAPGQTLSLTSTGRVNQSSGQIEASTLSVSARNGILLGGDNLVAKLGAFSNPVMGGVTYVSAGDPNLTGDIFAPGQTVNLIAATGGFNQTAGVITAGTLNVSAATGIALTDANAVTNLGQLVNTTSGGIAFTNVGDIYLSTDLAVPGQAVSLTSINGATTQAANEMIDALTLNASAANGVSFGGVNAIGNLGVISNSGSGGVVFTQSASFGLTGSITASGQTVALTSTSGAINQTQGVITAGVLNLAAVSGISLGDANLVASLGTVTNSESGGILYGSGANLDLTGFITASGQSIDLASTGAIDQTGGAIVAGTVGVSAGTSVALTELTLSNQAQGSSGGGAITVVARNGDVTAAQGLQDDDGSITVSAPNGNVTLGPTTGDGVTITAAGLAEITNASDVGLPGGFQPVAITAGQVILGSGGSYGGYQVTATNGNAQVGDIAFGANGSVSVSANNGTASLHAAAPFGYSSSLPSGPSSPAPGSNAVSVTASGTNGDVVIGGGDDQGYIVGAASLTAQASRDLTVAVTGALSLDTAQAGRNASITADALTLGTLTAGQDVTLTTPNPVTIKPRVTPTLSADSVYVGEDLTIVAGDAPLLGSITVGRNLSITAPDVSLAALSGQPSGTIMVDATASGFTYTSALTAGGAVDITAAGPVALGAVSAGGGDVRVNSQGAASLGDATAAGNITLNANGGSATLHFRRASPGPEAC